MASEEGVDHQEAHFRPALLLRGIPADLDPASEGRAGELYTDGKAGAGIAILRACRHAAKPVASNYRGGFDSHLEASWRL